MTGFRFFCGFQKKTAYHPLLLTTSLGYVELGLGRLLLLPNGAKRVEHPGSHNSAENYQSIFYIRHLMICKLQTVIHPVAGINACEVMHCKSLRMQSSFNDVSKATLMHFIKSCLPIEMQKEGWTSLANL